MIDARSYFHPATTKVFYGGILDADGNLHVPCPVCGVSLRKLPLPPGSGPYDWALLTLVTDAYPQGVHSECWGRPMNYFRWARIQSYQAHVAKGDSP